MLRAEQRRTPTITAYTTYGHPRQDCWRIHTPTDHDSAQHHAAEKAVSHHLEPWEPQRLANVMGGRGQAMRQENTSTKHGSFVAERTLNEQDSSASATRPWVRLHARPGQRSAARVIAGGEGRPLSGRPPRAQLQKAHRMHSPLWGVVVRALEYGHLARGRATCTMSPARHAPIDARLP